MCEYIDYIATNSYNIILCMIRFSEPVYILMHEYDHANLGKAD